MRGKVKKKTSKKEMDHLSYLWRHMADFLDTINDKILNLYKNWVLFILFLNVDCGTIVYNVDAEFKYWEQLCTEGHNTII